MFYKNARIFCPDFQFHIGAFEVKDGKFGAVLPENVPSDAVDLKGATVIPGLVEIHVNTNALPSSNADLMLDTTFESAEALKGYSTHPAHVAVANSKVRPYYKNRICLDYEV